MLTKFNRRTVATDSGEIIPHATVSFYWQFSGLPATVYADPEGGTPLGASVQSDPQGRLGVFMVPGYYRIVVTLGGEILDELTYEPIVNELAVSGSTDFAVHFAEMDAPASTSYMRTLPSGFSEWRTPAEVKSDLSLDQVNNTSDAQKPISIAVAAALAGKISSTEKGAANGVATLTAAGLIPPAQLPSYVDDVIERTDFASLPTTGETGKIYITTGNNKQYRWSGTAYVELVSSPGSTDAVPEGSTNKYFTEARVRTTPLTGYTLGSNATLASTDTILAALGKVQGQLNGKATTAQGAKADTALQPGANLSALTNDLALISQEAGDGRYTRRSQNLADLDNATTARANLDLIKTGNPLDMTSNRMLMTGDAGLLTFSAPLASANLQETIIPATYRVGGSESNSLKPGAAGVLRVEAYSDSIFTQYFTQNPISSPSAPSPILYRQVRAGVWSTTAEFWTTANDANLAKKDTAQTFSDSITINKNGSAVFSHQRGTDAADMYNDGAGGAVLRSRTATPAHLRVLTVKANYSAPQFYNAATALTYDVWTTAALSTTTVGYLSGLTSDVQTQLNGKAPATVEQNTRNASYTLAVTDNNKHIYHSNSSAYTWTIPPNSSVAFPIGATVTFVNDGSGNVTIAQGSGVTIVEAGNGTTGNKNLGAAGMATALKVGTDRWFLNGAGIY